MKIEIPNLRLISEANNTDHWRKKYARKKAIKSAVWAFWPHAEPTPEPPYRVTLTRIGQKALDPDNLANSFKSLQDQVAKQLGIDDGSDQVTWRYKQKATGKRVYGVRIEIERRSA